MDFGTIIGGFFADLAANLSLAAFGVMTFATVLCGLAMGMHVGGSKVQESIKGWFFSILGCAIFTGLATVIIHGIQARFTGGAPAAPAPAAMLHLLQVAMTAASSTGLF